VRPVTATESTCQRAPGFTLNSKVRAESGPAAESPWLHRKGSRFTAASAVSR